MAALSSDLEIARGALRRAAAAGDPIPPCSCFSGHRKGCIGVCEDAAGNVARVIGSARAAGAREMRKRILDLLAATARNPTFSFGDLGKAILALPMDSAKDANSPASAEAAE